VPPRWTQTLAVAPEADTSVLDRAWAERDEGVTLSPERFDERIARALASGAHLAELFLPDLFLAAACEAHDPAALRRFDQLLVALRPVAESFGVPGDEAIQQARVKLVVGDGRLSEYGGRSALTHWLKATVVNLALSLRRAQHHASSIDDPDLGILELPDVAEWAEETLSREQARQVLKAGLRRAMAKLSRTSRSLLRQHYLDAVTLETLAGYHGVHRATIARWIAEAKESLLGHLEAELHGQLDSLLGQVRSRATLGLRSLLASVS
jgi:RNA polymerase sigma-70 factor, ECF subfamily